MIPEKDSEEFVSIVIPCFNSERYIGEAIESAISQEGVDKEVVVVNDGSTDNSEKVIKKFGGKVRCFETRNKGACHARNLGLYVSKGSRVNFLDSDDVLAPESIKKKIHLDVNSSEIPAAHAVGMNGEDVGGKWSMPYYDLEWCLSFSTPQTSAPLHFKEDLLKVGGFDESLPCAQEYDLHLRLMVQLGKKFKSTCDVGTYIRVRGESLSRRKASLVRHTIKKVLVSLREQNFVNGQYDEQIGHHLLRLGQKFYRDGDLDNARAYIDYSLELLPYGVNSKYYSGLEKYLLRAISVEQYEFIRARLKKHLR